MQLALALKADLTISAGLHFRYGVSYNEFSVQSDPEQFRRKLLQSKSSFGEVWDNVRSQVEDVVDDQQRVLLNNGLAVTNRVPSATTASGAVNEEPAWKNTWNWNLPDAAYGHMVLDIQDGKISSEMISVGFNFAYRRSNLSAALSPTPIANNGAAISPAVVSAVPPIGPARGVPTGPSRGQQGGIPAAPGAVNAGKPPPKNPRSHSRTHTPTQSQQPSQGAAGAMDGNHQSRPASSKGARPAEGASVKESSEGAANGHAKPGEQTAATPKENSIAEAGLPTSTSNQSNKASKAKPNRRKSGSGWSSKSETEKSGEEGGLAPTKPTESGEGEEDKEKRDGARGSGRGARGAGRGGRGGRGGSNRGSSGLGPNQERRKASTGGEKEAGGAPKEASSAPKEASSAPKEASIKATGDS